MSDPLPDEELQAIFERQRTADRGRAPGIHSMRTRALEMAASASRKSGAPLWRWLVPTGATLAVAIAISLATHHPTAPSPRDALAQKLDAIEAALRKSAAAQHELTAWQAPTDFLLYPTHDTTHP